MTQEITVKMMQEMIENIKCCRPVSIDTVTEPKMNKTGNPYFGKVQKVCTVNGLIGFDYETTVNNQLAREGKDESFVAQPRKWGTLVGNLVFHKEKVYLQVKPQSLSQLKDRILNEVDLSEVAIEDFLSNASEKDGKVLYLFEGQPIAKSVLEPWLVKSSKPHTQDGLVKEVPVRDYELCNITGIRMVGNSFKIMVAEKVAEKVAAKEPVVAE